MKFVKKITALFLAVTMVMAMGITASAATITGPKNTHTYNVYQIFTGDYDATSGKLSNIKWGANGTGTVGQAVDEKVLNALTALNDSTEAQITDGVKTYWNSSSSPVKVLNDTDDKYEDAAAGYYLITDANNADYQAIISVVKDLKINPKTGDTPTFEKKIKDINDSTDTTTGEWQDSADYDIEDTIPFKLEGTVANDYASYETYKFIFHDVEETGLTYQNVTSVYVQNGDAKTAVDPDKYEVVTTGLKDGCSFEVKFNNLKNIEAVKGGSKIVVEYTSKLNDEAVLGNQGNVNKAQLEYSNKPSSSGEGDNDNTGKTPWDYVIVFTYKTVINKVDDQTTPQPLTGAEFTLEKFVASAEGSTTYKEVKGDWQASKTATLNGTKTEFTFKGIDDGYYRLTETKTPAGYNTISPIYFTVTASHNAEWNEGGANRTAVLTDLVGAGSSEDGKIEFNATKNLADGSLTSNVVNKKGSTLPSTGGMGTTILYVAGIALIVVAGVVVIARKRNA